MASGAKSVFLPLALSFQCLSGFLDFSSDDLGFLGFNCVAVI